MATEDEVKTPAIASPWQLLAKPAATAAAIVAPLLALATFMGWRFADSYFRGLGAPWAVDLLSRSQIAMYGTTVLIPLAVGAAVAWYLIFLGAKEKAVAKVGMIFAAFACLSFAVVLFKLPAQWKISVSNVGAYSYALFAGGMIYMLGMELLDRKLELERRRSGVSSLIAFLFIGGLTVPSVAGNNKAEHDLSPRSVLAVACQPQGDSGTWRVVRHVDNRSLLVRQVGNEKPVFAVVVLDSSWVVVSTLDKDKLSVCSELIAV